MPTFHLNTSELEKRAILHRAGCLAGTGGFNEIGKYGNWRTALRVARMGGKSVELCPVCIQATKRKGGSSRAQTSGPGKSVRE